MSQLSVIGISHRTAPVAVRERVALPGDLARQFLEKVRREPVLEEALLLDTCNRTELYFVGPVGAEALDYFLTAVAALKEDAPLADRAAFYRHDGPAAVRHLFRVAASLDSQIVGEHEILGQVRAAYRRAVRARTTRTLLNRLLHAAFRAGKRVRTETALGRGSAGVAGAAVELAEHIFSGLGRKTVLLLGAGETGEQVARALVRAGAGRLVVANRTLQRAEQLAREIPSRPPRAADCEAEPPSGEGPAACPARLRAGAEGDGGAIPGGEEDAAERPPIDTEAVELDAVRPWLGQADLVIASTGAPEVVLTEADAGPALSHRDRPVVILDIAVPRDVDERLGRLGNVFLYNLDDLGRIVERNLERRREEIPRAEAIVDFEVTRFSRWLRSREVVPTIRLLRRHFARLRTDEIAQHAAEFNGTDAEQLDAFARHLLGRVLHGPFALLRESAEEGTLSERLAVVDAVWRMFALDTINQEAEAAEPPEDHRDVDAGDETEEGEP